LCSRQKLFGLIYPDSSSEEPRALETPATVKPHLWEIHFPLISASFFPPTKWKSKYFMFQVRSLLYAEVGSLKMIWLRSQRKWLGEKSWKKQKNKNMNASNCENALNAFPFCLSLVHCNQSVGHGLWKIVWICWPELPTSNYPQLQSLKINKSLVKVLKCKQNIYRFLTS